MYSPRIVQNVYLVETEFPVFTALWTQLIYSVSFQFEGFTAEGIGQVEAEAEEQSYINLLEILVFDAKRKGEGMLLKILRR
jgi:hypothetical protein